MTSTSSPGGAPLLDVSNLSRAFGPRQAVAGVSFSLAPGECLALFGPNGAGKTTLLRVLAGLLKPSGGGARIDGTAVGDGSIARSRVGFISHHTMLYEALSPRENVDFAARLHGVRDTGRVEESLNRMSLLGRADAPVRALSRGMQQRVAIARATVHSPRLVLADEPYSGLDESGARVLTTMLQELRGSGTAIIVVTHNIYEGLSVATHAAVMARGRFMRFEESYGLEAASYADAYRELVAVPAA